MTTMTDEAAEKIADSTIKKFSKAGRKAVILIVDEKNGKACTNMEPDDFSDAIASLTVKCLGKDAPKAVKKILKLSKEKKNGTKH